MWATWFQGTYEEFIAANLAGYAKGVRIYHFLGGTSIDIKGKRAIAQTKMSISQRAAVEGVECDVICIGRFYDFLEKRKGQWGLVWRRLTYEKDQIAPVDPAKAPKLDPKLLARFPVGYQHLAYLQTKVGYKVKDGHAGRRWAGDRRALRAWARTGSRAAQEDRVVKRQPFHLIRGACEACVSNRVRSAAILRDAPSRAPQDDGRRALAPPAAIH